MVWKTRVQSQVESYQRPKKWYLIQPCLTLSIIKYGSRIKWRNPGNRVAPSPTPRCSSYWKGNLRVTLDYGGQLYLLTEYLLQIHASTYTNYIEYLDIRLFCFLILGHFKVMYIHLLYITRVKIHLFSFSGFTRIRINWSCILKKMLG